MLMILLASHEELCFFFIFSHYLLQGAVKGSVARRNTFTKHICMHSLFVLNYLDLSMISHTFSLNRCSIYCRWLILISFLILRSILIFLLYPHFHFRSLYLSSFACINACLSGDWHLLILSLSIISLLSFLILVLD